MIGSRGYRITEPPRTSSSQAHALPLPGPFQHLRAGPALRARAPPATRKIATRRWGKASVTAIPVPKWHWASGGTRQPRQTTLHPKPTTERNRIRNGVTV
jgi:hypothetical protein